MRDCRKFYVGGEWVDPFSGRVLDVINPANESIAGQISLGSEGDVDRAVRAAHAAFPMWSQSSRQERISLIDRIGFEYEARYDDMAQAITEEMGAPISLARSLQAFIGKVHLQTTRALLETYMFEEDRGTTRIVREPIGVCGLITPWNWPMNQIAAKVCPALATGCTMILKPSEIAPFSAVIWAEILHAAGVPKGVFNLVNGDGDTVGKALCQHSLVDMVSFTGSTRAGIEVARNAAATVKRVAQELGGKSPFIILDDADFPAAVKSCVTSLMKNSGQSCNAPSRLLVPLERMSDVVGIARLALESWITGDPNHDVMMGPVVSKAQWQKIQSLIAAGIDEGATLVTGGLGRPAGLTKGFYVRPTVFANVKSNMRIAREEIFGPVLSILGYKDTEEAIEIGNDTEFGLAAYVVSADIGRARKVASRLRAGQVGINGGAHDPMAPFGGYKKSGNGREWGDFGFAEYLEIKAVLGYTNIVPSE